MTKEINVSDLIFFNNTKEECVKFIRENNIENMEFFLEFDDTNQTEKVDYILDNINFKNISFHGPYRYFNVDCDKHTWEENKRKYIKAMQYTKEKNGKFIVLHTNEEIKENSLKDEIEKNIDELIEEGKRIGVDLLIENVGVGKNMLYSESEFIDLAERKDYKILLDIGHLFANKWNLEKVLTALKDRIIAYHLHNNDGEQDLHTSLFNGIFKGEEILKIIEMRTPDSTLVLEYSAKTKKEELINDLEKLKYM